jgi:hypothetical protein
MRRPVEGPVGALGHWDTPRPLDSTPKTHIHGALDIIAPVGTPIVAPERGKVCGFKLTRPEGRTDVWVRSVGDRGLPWNFYTYDMYGGVLVLEGASGLVHLFCHLFMNQLWRYSVFHSPAWTPVEEEAKQRWPMELWHTLDMPIQVNEGQQIGVIGDAGFTKGDHLHWEIHKGWVWTPYDERPDPEKL